MHRDTAFVLFKVHEAVREQYLCIRHFSQALGEATREFVLFALNTKRIACFIGYFAEVKGVDFALAAISILEYRCFQALR